MYKIRKYIVLSSFIIVLFLVLSNKAAFGANIYVSTTGVDTNNGLTSGTAVASFERACELANAGDTVTFLAGDYYYSEEQRIDSNCNGTSGNHTVFQTNGTVTIHGSSMNLSNKDSILFITTQYSIIDGFVFQDSTERGVSVYQTNNVTIRNNTIYNTGTRGLGGSGDDIIYEGNTIYEASKDFENDTVSTGHWPAALATTFYFDTGEPSRNITIRNNRVYNSHGEGIGAFSVSGATIEGNIVYDNYGVNIYVDTAEDITVTGNYSYATKDTQNREKTGRPSGIQLADEGTNPSVGVLENITISNNVIANTSKGIRYMHADWLNSNPDNTYRDIRIINNTFWYDPTYLSNVSSSSPDDRFHAVEIDEVPSGYNSPGGTNIIQNNIIYNGPYGGIRIGNESIWTFSHNNWVDGIPTNPSNVNDGNSISVDPLYVNPADGNSGGLAVDYKLQSGSPTMLGVLSTYALTDYEGTTRDDPPTMGAFESTDSPTATPTNTPTITPTATLTLPPTSTLTPTSTITPTLSPTATSTLTPTATLTPTITLTNTPTSTPPITNTITPTPSLASTSTPTPTTSAQPSGSPTPSNFPQTPSPTPIKNSSSDSSNTVVYDPEIFTCAETPPGNAPDLFQIDVSHTKARLYFTPVNPVSKYIVLYGFNSGDERYGAIYDSNQSAGVVDFTINELLPNVTYAFKVQGTNNCASGPWSQWIEVKTLSGNIDNTLGDTSVLYGPPDVRQWKSYYYYNTQ